MAQNLKHVGRMIASNKKVLVAYRTLPGDAYSCLVVPTESLDLQYYTLIQISYYSFIFKMLYYSFCSF